MQQQEEGSTMDKIIFRTINSAYSLDHDTMTWQRLQNLGDTDPHSPLRDEWGTLWAHGRIEVGFPAVFYGPSKTEFTDVPEGQIPVRRITTSLVTEVLSGDTTPWNLDRLEELSHGA